MDPVLVWSSAKEMHSWRMKRKIQQRKACVLGTAKQAQKEQSSDTCYTPSVLAA